jgi:hypothetical protein
MAQDLRMNTPTLCLILLSSAAATSVHAAGPVWSGSARCDVTTTGTGYTDRQTHRWTTTAGAPTKSGAFNIYPGTWSVSGGGSLDRSQGDQTLHAEWTRTVAGMSGPISVVVRASDGVILINAGHAQLRAKDALTGSQEVRRGGHAISSTKIGAEAFEFSFPVIKGNSGSTHLAGQTSDAPKGSFGYMQPGGATTQVNCSWDFQLR